MLCCCVSETKWGRGEYTGSQFCWWNNYLFLPLVFNRNHTIFVLGFHTKRFFCFSAGKLPLGNFLVDLMEISALQPKISIPNLLTFPVELSTIILISESRGLKMEIVFQKRVGEKRLMLSSAQIAHPLVWL